MFLKIYFAFANVVRSQFIVVFAQVFALNEQILNFFEIWLFDIDVSFHMINNRNFLIDFKVIFNFSIKNIEKKFNFLDYKIVRFFCKIFNENRYFIVNYIFYVSSCQYNFLSFVHFQQNDCFLSMIFNDFAIDIKDIYVFWQCDFYILQLKKLITCLFVNFDTLKIWHERLNYLSNQNVVKLIHRVDIDFFKSSSFDFYVFCEKKINDILQKSHCAWTSF